MESTATVANIEHTPTVATLDSTPHKVFVYGTLKMGYPNHSHYLGNAKLLGTTLVSGVMFHLGRYPAINLSEQFSHISGEVYECTWDDVLAMDRLEGCPGLYERVQVFITGYHLVWVYVMTKGRLQNHQDVIPTGIWTGPNTPKVKWRGWDEGISIGSTYSTIRDEIKVGPGEVFILKKDPSTNKLNLIDKSSGAIIGVYSRVVDNFTHPPALVTNNVTELPTNRKPNYFYNNQSFSRKDENTEPAIPVAAKLLEIKVQSA